MEVAKLPKSNINIVNYDFLLHSYIYKFIYSFLNLCYIYYYVSCNTNLLLAECKVRTASYGPRFFLPFMAQVQSTRAMKTRKEKMRIHNLPYGLSKQG